MNDDTPPATFGDPAYERIELNCRHLGLRPPGWRQVAPFDFVIQSGGFLGVQAKIDAYAAELGTPWWTPAEVAIQGLGKQSFKWPLVLCPACDAAERARVGLPPANGLLSGLQRVD